ncbi:ABC-type sugar transport system ATPase subunit [Paraburkholderia youngii]|uniref:ABC-type sugar transport system ATPase subunit n=1 Tax=Paraburkholderia atlantica TaxID=2654982 RepID=A0A7W8V4G7_PARAM|nr:sugar ABC transporter ATP-binding protein [Paraburkholderia atlantica]MBB5415785.1 ABC-type sugar transport system ATPase subunit [Paraburkholderia atlantica]MBB5422603.1 ABC-type sugar transport system ATPase subunit [Paraburkholderia atlantica]
MNKSVPGLGSDQPAKAGALLEGRGLGKSYGSVSVLRGVDIAIRAGEVLAVLGENGAGKSTLMRILSGIIPQGEYEGSIEIDGAPAHFASLSASEEAGIVLVPQELHVIPHLSIAENMFASRLPGRFGLYDETAAVRMAREALEVFGLNVDPRARSAILTPSERRLIVLAAALHRSARVLILDEPTAAMTDVETDLLFEQLRLIRDAGVGIVHITHRLDELGQIADRILVLRNGAVTGRFNSVPAKAELVQAMLGETFEANAQREPSSPRSRRGAPVLQVKNLSVYVDAPQRRARSTNVSLEVYPGEVVGLYGLVGAGRTELARALFGAWPGPVTGECVIAGHRGVPRNTHEARRRGMSLLAEDRKSQGVMRGQSISNNMTASMLEDFSMFKLLIDIPRERRHVADMIAKLGVRPADPGVSLNALSGGNQQKVLLARCLFKGLKVLILDEPTLGVDIGARVDIYKEVQSIARERDVGVLIISSDLEEILAEADRVFVMYKSRIQGEFARGVTSHELLSAATGALHA